MKIDQQQLFSDLMALCDNPDFGFYFADREYDGFSYRIFSYRLIGSYTMWTFPNALNCRGTMFVKKDDAWTLVSLPMEKFFRMNENPLTMDLNIDDRHWQIYEKFDGSLISSFINPSTNDVDFKSKTSLSSDHVIVARRLLNNPKNATFKQYCLQRELDGFTVNMELTSEDPNLRIVVPYSETSLRLLCERNRSTGEVHQMLPIMDVRTTDSCHDMTLREAINFCETLTGVEGFVAFNTNTNKTIKLKTVWYDNLHTTKNNLNSIDHIIRLILTETIDDFKAMFDDDVGIANRIKMVEDAVVPVYNHLMYTATSFFENHKHEDRKTYAVGAKAVLNEFEFKVAMESYIGRPIDFTEYLIKNKSRYFNLTANTNEVEHEE